MKALQVQAAVQLFLLVYLVTAIVACACGAKFGIWMAWGIAGAAALAVGGTVVWVVYALVYQLVTGRRVDE